MKCPKCGYNSFEFHNTCKKCSNDLTGYKETYGLKSIVLPPEARNSLAESFRPETAEPDRASEVAETTSDMFTFDIPEGEPDTPAATSSANDNPFNFDEEPSESQTKDFGSFSFDESPTSAPQDSNDFSLDKPTETPSQDFGEFSFDEPAATQAQVSGDFSFDGDQKSSQTKAEEDAFANLLDSSPQDAGGDTPTGAAPQESAFSSDTGEFNLDSFSWDDTPATPAEAEAKMDDNLSSIFDNTDDSSKK